MDLAACLRSLGPIPDIRVERMSTREQAHVRSKQGPCANGNFASIENGRVEIDKHIIAELHIGPIVDANRWFYPGIFGEELFILVFRCSWWRERRGITDDTPRSLVFEVDFTEIDGLHVYSRHSSTRFRRDTSPELL